MKTRLRHFRTHRGLTQGELARRLGTTAATVSRLETADMTVSTDWLEKFAEVLDVPVSELIAAPGAGEAALAGSLSGDGDVIPPRPGETAVGLGLTARAPVALRVEAAFGPYQAGDLLVGSKREPDEARHLAGQDCILSASGKVRFGRMVSTGDDDALMLVPVTGSKAERIAGVDWIAPLSMMIRRFD